MAPSNSIAFGEGAHDMDITDRIIAKLREMGHEPTARPCRCQEDPT